MFELIHESIWVASHMTFTKHFAPNGNIGDIVAKDDAQMSTAHLLGMLSGVGLISVSHTPLFLFGVFAVLSPINIWSTVKLLNAADFEILNQAKLTLLSREFINQGSVIGYDQLKNKEIGFGEWVKPSAHIVKINLGASAEQAYENTDEIRDVLEIMKHENYLLNYHDHTMWVSLHEDATSNDVIRAILHSMKLHDALKDGSKGFLSCLQDTLEWSKEKYPKFVVELDQKNWQSDIVYWNDSGVRLDWKNHIKENDDPVIIN
ncbi:hypothetical protein BDB01DRAFT_408817 [Pilobolus umbonatus]|nr:hypothetical protein BDB01DRAFT_408817 [Pilobolus umbonatus]